MNDPHANNNENKYMLSSLSSVERMVLNVLTAAKIHPEDVRTISRLCNVPEFQASAALKLLEIKKLLPGSFTDRSF